MKKPYCPSIENPCMCYCHLEALQRGEDPDWNGACEDCRMGRHKEKIKEVNQ